eukprot:TRINITY_DN26327_c0_g7_i1.p1 TRINITY_DN26327_c0_g7~~TRINITY_DN26327_c0_g7_i1.p1  ORF type:complete len:633 (+),score=124.37 TRINITY_DN26327_c0_g7_i1:89-1987(+)
MAYADAWPPMTPPRSPLLDGGFRGDSSIAGVAPVAPAGVGDLITMGERRLRAGSLQCAHVAATPHAQSYFQRAVPERHAVLDTVQSEVILSCDGRISRVPWALFRDAHASWRVARVLRNAEDARAALRRAEAAVGTPAKPGDNDGLALMDAVLLDLDVADGTDGHWLQLHRLSCSEWWAFEERKARAPLKPAPCLHIAAQVPPEAAACCALAEHHAVIDVEAGEVIHFWRRDGCKASEDALEVVAQPAEEFHRCFQSWRVVELPASPQHAREVLHRARRRIGERGYDVTSNNCEHFATWCFTGEVSSTQVSGAVARTALSSAASAGLGYGAASTVTYTVTTPYYALGLIPLGSTTSTVGLSSYALAGAAGLGLGVGLVASAAAYAGANAMARHSGEQLSLKVPICIGNKTMDEELRVTVRNLDSALQPVLGRLSLPSLDATAHAVLRRGVGRTQETVVPQTLAELNPPAYEACYERFELCVESRSRVTALLQPSAASAAVPSSASSPEPRHFAAGATASSSLMSTSAATAEQVSIASVSATATSAPVAVPEGQASEGSAGDASSSWLDYVPGAGYLSKRSSAVASAPTSATSATQALVGELAQEAWREVGRQEVRRGDVLIYLGGGEFSRVE